MNQADVPFAAQRVICFALLLGMTFYAIVAAVVLQTSDGQGLAGEPIAELDTLAVVLGVATTIGAVVLRIAMRKRAEKLSGGERRRASFQSILLPLAILEGGCLLAITAWLLNGTAIPSLVVALVMLAVAIAIVPFTDPDAGS